MAVLALVVAGNAIGAAIGGTFLGVAAATWGGVAGGLVGNLLFAPDGPNIQGPRLGDLKSQSSALGMPIPIVYGTARLAGNMIWSAPITETAHVTESGGGKGGGGSSTQTSYTYAQSFAIAICDCEIAGVLRIWANGELIYNVSTTADAATGEASADVANLMTVYYGTETQTASSLIEADVGAGDTPAYRGTAYVTFENMQLADYGNRAPNLEFEVISMAAGSAEIALTALSSAVVEAARVECFCTAGKYTYLLLSTQILRIYNTSDPANPVLLSSTDIDTDSFDNPAQMEPILIGNYVVLKRTNTLVGSIQFVNVEDPAAPFLIPASSFSVGGFSSALVYHNGWIYCSAASDLYYIDVRDPYNMVSVSLAFPAGMQGGGLWIDGDYLYVSDYGTDPLLIYEISTGVPTLAASVAGVAGDSICGTNKSNYMYVPSTATLKIYDITDPLLPVVVATPALTIADLDHTLGDNFAVYLIGSNLSLYSLATPSAPVLVNALTLSGSGSAMMRTAGNLIVGCRGTTWQTFGIGGATLAATVTDICTRAGLTTGDIDVTDLTDTLDGYIVTRSRARDQIKQLAQAYFFDAVESAGVNKFVTRGGASVFDIAEDDLAAHPYGSETPPSLIKARQQEMELPVELAVQYLETAAAYQIGTQASQRLTTSSQNKQSINLALAMSATKAKQIADVLMYDAWTARTAFDFATGWKYAHLEPTDVGTLTKGGRTYTVRIVSEDTSGGIGNRQAVLEDTSVYTQTATAAALPVPADTVRLIPLTWLKMLDIPLLRDQDDGYGFYVAACGYTDAWAGAQMYKSTDDGGTWASFSAAIFNAASIGVATTILGTFTQNIFDESGSVTVTMRNGELSSDTEINVLNGANVALLGDEIIQFKNATLVSTGIYTLTGLLRGRLGTEWARSTHAVGDDFIVLTTTTTYLTVGASAEYDLARLYRGVSFGKFLEDASDVSFTNTAVAQTPYSPVQLGGGRNAALDITINWIRRTRIAGGWLNNADSVLGEASEAYEVEIYSSNTYVTVKRTITGLSSPTTTYTAAQQTTDFGSTQATIYFIVYQISATVGRGYEARGVV